MENIPEALWLLIGGAVTALLGLFGNLFKTRTDGQAALNATLIDQLARQEKRIRALEDEADVYRSYERLSHRGIMIAREFVHKIDRVRERQTNLPPSKRTHLPSTAPLTAVLDSLEAAQARGGEVGAREPPDAGN